MLFWAASSIRALVGEVFDFAKSNVFFGKQLIAHVVLEDDADLFAQVFDVVFAEIDAVEEDLSGGGIVKAGEQLDQGGFSGSIFADKGNFFLQLPGGS